MPKEKARDSVILGARGCSIPVYVRVRQRERETPEG